MTAPAAAIDDAEVAPAEAEMLEPFEAQRRREPVHELQEDLQEMMRTTSASSATRSGLTTALDELEALKQRARALRVAGDRAALQPELAPGLDVQQHARRIAEAIARAALLRKESRGAHSRARLPRAIDDDWARGQRRRSQQRR